MFNLAHFEDLCKIRYPNKHTFNSISMTVIQLVVSCFILFGNARVNKYAISTQ